MSVSSIISQFGGSRPLARVLGYPPTTVQNWELRESIPAKHLHKILKAAVDAGIDLKPEHLIPKLNGHKRKRHNGKE